LPEGLKKLVQTEDKKKLTKTKKSKHFKKSGVKGHKKAVKKSEPKKEEEFNLV